MATGKSYPLSVVVDAVDKITAPLKKITATMTAFGAKVSNIGGRFRELGDRSGLPVLTNAIGKVGGAVGALGKRVALVGAGIVALGVTGVAALVPLAKAYADTTGAIGDLAQQTGASRERIQELGYAAQLSGSSAEALGGALQKMNLAVGNATKGSKELQDMFAGLQINLKNSNGTLKTTDELFDLFVNRISRIKNPALQAQAAVKIFGKSATELLPLIRSGNKGIAEMAAEARRLGVVISDDAVQSGEEFGDVLDKMAFALKGVGNTIAAAVVPALSRLATGLIDTIVKYRPQIEAFAAAFADNLPTYIDQAIQAFHDLMAVLEPLGGAVVWLSESMGTFKLLLAALTGTVIAMVLPAVIGLVGAIYGLGTALLATPIGWFLLGIAAIAGGATLIYKNWDQFASFFTDKFDTVKASFKDNFVLGLVSIWKEFNPVSLMLESLNGLIKFATGIDVGAILKEKMGMGGDTGGGGPSPNYTAVPEGGPIAAGLANAKAQITVDFKNLPTGADVDTNAGQGAKVQVNQGYSMMAVR